MKTIYVLWVLYTTPWSLGPIPMNPGWFSASVHVGLSDCIERSIHQPRATACVIAGDPPPGDLAEVIRAW